MESNEQVKTKLVGAILPIGLLALWLFLTRERVVDPIFLPSPSGTLESLRSLLSANFLLEHLAPSIVRVSTAFALSTLLAFPLGVFSGQSPLFSRLLHPTFAFARYLPVAALVPLCILWFGIDDAQKIAVITLGLFFQLVILIANDTASVPKDLIEVGYTVGLTRLQVVRHIVLPWSMPAIWDDLRVSAGWAWSYLVLAELVAGNRGIGYYIVQSQRFLDTDKAFAGIVLIGMLGFLTDLSFRYAAIRLFRWT